MLTVYDSIHIGVYWGIRDIMQVVQSDMELLKVLLGVTIAVSSITSVELLQGLLSMPLPEYINRYIAWVSRAGPTVLARYKGSDNNMMVIAYCLGKSYTSPCRRLVLSSNWVSKLNKLHECQVDPMRCIFETSFPNQRARKVRGDGETIITAAPYSPPLGPPQSRSRYFLATEAVQNGVSPPFVLRRVSVHCRALLLDCADNTLIVPFALAPKRSRVQIFYLLITQRSFSPLGLC